MSTRKPWRAALTAGSFVLAVVASAAGAVAGVTKSVVWTGAGGNGHSYQVVADDGASWSQAEHAAFGAGGYLATSESPAEQSFIESLLATSRAGTGSYWFGLHKGPQGNYRWITRTPLNYTHWLPSPPQPDNQGGRETSGAILWSNAGDRTYDRRGYWNDLPNVNPTSGSFYPDLNRAGYLVEYNRPLPGAAGLQLPTSGSSQAGSSVNATTSIPLPTALALSPFGAAAATLASRRMRRRRR